MDADAAERIKALLQQPLDWDYILEKARQHLIIPLLYASIKTTCPDTVPEATLAKLREEFHANARRNLLLTGELLKLLRLLEANGVSAIPFKGPILAASAYGNLSLRSFWDLDILVRRGDVLKTKNLLLTHGYRPCNHLTDAEEQVHLQSPDGKDFRFVRADGEVMVELHWKVANSAIFPLESNRLWEWIAPTAFAGTTVLNFLPEDLLLILCVHGTKHYWSRLEWICDVAEVIRAHPTMDWSEIRCRAKQLGIERMFHLGILLANEVLAMPIPDEVSESVRSDRKARLLMDKVCRWSFSELACSPGFFERHTYQVNIKERFRDTVQLRLHYWLYYFETYVTPTARDRAMVSLPKTLFFIYYFIRPFRLAREYALTPVKHLLKSLTK
jgi:hypothetical protein